MNILLKLPDDIQEKIYKIIHKDYMTFLINDIKNLKYNKLNSRTEQHNYIEEQYPNMTVKYNITDGWNFINPDEIASIGLYKILVGGKDNSSIILKDPSYGDLYKCAEIKFNNNNANYTFIDDSNSDSDSDNNIKDHFSDITEHYICKENISVIDFIFTPEPHF